VKIGDGDWFDPETLQQGSLYILPTQSPTNGRSLAVRAIDNAGNIQEEDITFRVAAPNSWQEQWYRLIHFLSLFELLLVAAILVLVVVAYAFIYRLLTWRRRLRRELQEFKKELREEIERMNNEKNKEGSDIDLRPATLKKEKQFIEKEGERLKKDIETEVEKIKKLTGDK
jgi:flagellar biosynthesis/type III secretory pathway M-ring protein FliF/YscJ